MWIVVDMMKGARRSVIIGRGSIKYVDIFQGIALVRTSSPTFFPKYLLMTLQKQ